MYSDKNGLCVLGFKNEFQESMNPQNCMWSFGWRKLVLEWTFVAVTWFLKNPGLQASPDCPKYCLLLGYSVIIPRPWHTQTLGMSKISQIPYSENSLKFCGCLILLYLASFVSAIIFPVSEVYILHGDTHYFWAIIIFSLLQLRYILYPQIFMQCDP